MDALLLFPVTDDDLIVFEFDRDFLPLSPSEVAYHRDRERYRVGGSADFGDLADVKLNLLLHL